MYNTLSYQEGSLEKLHFHFSKYFSIESWFLSSADSLNWKNIKFSLINQLNKVMTYLV